MSDYSDHHYEEISSQDIYTERRSTGRKRLVQKKNRSIAPIQKEFKGRRETLEEYLARGQKIKLISTVPHPEE